MHHLGLIACVKKKLAHTAPAKELYVSSLFRYSRRYVETHCDAWLILSAKYGLVRPEDVIAPYEETLNAKRAQERGEWAARVWEDLQHHITNETHITCMAGKKYREKLVPHMVAHGCHVDVPLEGLGLGKQLQWLKQESTKIDNDSPSIARGEH